MSLTVDAPSDASESDRSIGRVGRARAGLAAVEVLQRLRQTDSRPTAEDLRTLRGWPGWGPMAPVFELARKGSFAEIGERLEFLLPDTAYAEGAQATYNAFYTPEPIVDACWQILRDLGFTGGTVLEPGCGAGAFMARTPEDVDATWFGVERDPTTASIATLLHPQATILNKPFEQADIPFRSVDAVLGNVPYGDVPVHDPTATLSVTRSLHNYFIWRAVQSLRPGGIAVLLTSRYTLDGHGTHAEIARYTIGEDAQLLGAIRLPNQALASGGTETVADIVILRRRSGTDPGNTDTWLKAVPALDGAVRINPYFRDNPGHVLGVTTPDYAPRYGRTLRVDRPPDAPPLAVDLRTAGEAITRRALRDGRSWSVEHAPEPFTAATAPFPRRADGRKEGSFHLVDGAVHEVVDGAVQPVKRAGQELKRLVQLRDATLALLDAESDHTKTDDELAPLRAELNARYDDYVAAHGSLNRFTITEGEPDEETGEPTLGRRVPRMGGFRRDPDFLTVLALEDFDDDTQTATKAALFHRRVNTVRQPTTRASSPAEALGLSLDRHGRIVPSTVARLLDIPEEQVPEQLHGLAFTDPATGDLVPAGEYLSGDVRFKLRAARAAAEQDPQRFAEHVEALEKVQPQDLTAEEIQANLGASWIPTSDIQQFAQETFHWDVTIRREPRTATWEVSTSSFARRSPAATVEWGTVRADAFTLLERALNGQAPVVYDKIRVNGVDRNVRNHEETMLAEEKQRLLAERFTTWIWEDPQRCDRLVAAYNERFNAIVPRRFDGSHLTFPGLDPDFRPYAHQKDMVARMVAVPNNLCPFPVGTGKTATIFMGALKLKELGLVTKPMIVVPLPVLEQIARDGKRLFPNARILLADRQALKDARARKLFAARCATEDWDAVVISHTAFASIPVHPRTALDYVEQLKSEYRTALACAPDDAGRRIKQIAKKIQRLETRSRELLELRRDDGVFFEHLGVDKLMVDEFHYFKGLDTPVHTEGFGINPSKRATDLDMKLFQLRCRARGLGETGVPRVLTAFTGTPVTNTLLELYVLQRYLQPERLAAMDIRCADAWAANFVRFESQPEIGVDGSFRTKRRPREIINIPDVMGALAEVAELRPPGDFAVQRPDVRTHPVTIDGGDVMAEFIDGLAQRADALRSGRLSRADDNMLAICGDGRKAAVDLSLVDTDSDTSGKPQAVVDQVARIYHATKDLALPDDPPDVRGGFQLVFLDLGTPHAEKGSQVYGKIRAGLITAGVPAARIRFIHDYPDPMRRQALFDDCTNGRVSILLGSTDKLGVGVNVQHRCVALHHVDPPWRPDQVEQREGRAVRPGNRNKAVDIYRYVVAPSLDGFSWQALERKERGIRPLFSGRITDRVIEDIGDVAASYAEMKALATGNPLLLELADLDAQIARLSSMARAHTRDQRRLEWEVDAMRHEARRLETTVEAWEALHAATTTADDTWRDTHATPIPTDDVPAHLAALATTAAHRGQSRDGVTWRGIHIRFTRTDIAADLTLRLTAGTHPVTLPIPLTWLNKGQHWRLRATIASTINDAESAATERRQGLEDHQSRLAETRTKLGLPFPRAAELAEARNRHAELTATIEQEAAENDRDNEPTPDEPSELAAEATEEKANASTPATDQQPKSSVSHTPSTGRRPEMADEAREFLATSAATTETTATAETTDQPQTTTTTEVTTTAGATKEPAPPNQPEAISQPESAKEPGKANEPSGPPRRTESVAPQRNDGSPKTDDQPRPRVEVPGPTADAPPDDNATPRPIRKALSTEKPPSSSASPEPSPGATTSTTNSATEPPANPTGAPTPSTTASTTPRSKANAPDEEPNAPAKEADTLGDQTAQANNRLANNRPATNRPALQQTRHSIPDRLTAAGITYDTTVDRLGQLRFVINGEHLTPRAAVTRYLTPATHPSPQPGNAPGRAPSTPSSQPSDRAPQRRPSDPHSSADDSQASGHPDPSDHARPRPSPPMTPSPPAGARPRHQVLRGDPDTQPPPEPQPQPSLPQAEAPTPLPTPTEEPPVPAPNTEPILIDHAPTHTRIYHVPVIDHHLQALLATRGFTPTAGGPWRLPDTTPYSTRTRQVTGMIAALKRQGHPHTLRTPDLSAPPPVLPATPKPQPSLFEPPRTPNTPAPSNAPKAAPASPENATPSGDVPTPTPAPPESPANSATTPTHPPAASAHTEPELAAQPTTQPTEAQSSTAQHPPTPSGEDMARPRSTPRSADRPPRAARPTPSPTTSTHRPQPSTPPATQPPTRVHRTRARQVRISPTLANPTAVSTGSPTTGSSKPGAPTSRRPAPATQTHADMNPTTEPPDVLTLLDKMIDALTDVTPAAPPPTPPPGTQHPPTRDDPVNGPDPSLDDQPDLTAYRQALAAAREARNYLAAQRRAREATPNTESITIAAHPDAAANNAEPTAGLVATSAPTTTMSTARPTPATPTARSAAPTDAETDAFNAFVEANTIPLAAVDAAAAAAEASDNPATRTEAWTQMRAVLTAARTLWHSIATGVTTYTRDLITDIRLHGLLTTLTARLCRTIADLTGHIANHLIPDIHTAPPTLQTLHTVATAHAEAPPTPPAAMSHASTPSTPAPSTATPEAPEPPTPQRESGADPAPQPAPQGTTEPQPSSATSDSQHTDFSPTPHQETAQPPQPNAVHHAYQAASEHAHTIADHPLWSQITTLMHRADDIAHRLTNNPTPALRNGLADLHLTLADRATTLARTLPNAPDSHNPHRALAHLADIATARAYNLDPSAGRTEPAAAQPSAETPSSTSKNPTPGPQLRSDPRIQTQVGAAAKRTFARIQPTPKSSLASASQRPSGSASYEKPVRPRTIQIRTA